jgi:hypothetical protein
MAQNSEHIEAKLNAFIEGELDAAGRADIEQHLQANPQHRELMGELAETRKLLAALPRQKAPSEMVEALLGQLERSSLLDDVSTDQGESLRLSRWPQFMSIAAILLLTLGLGAVIYFVLPELNQPSTVAIVPHYNRVEAPSEASRGESKEDADLLAKDEMPERGRGKLIEPSIPLMAKAEAERKESKSGETAALKKGGDKEIDRDGGLGGGLKWKQSEAVIADDGQGARDRVYLVCNTNDPTATSKEVRGYLTANKISWSADADNFGGAEGREAKDGTSQTQEKAGADAAPQQVKPENVGGMKAAANVEAKDQADVSQAAAPGAVIQQKVMRSQQSPNNSMKQAINQYGQEFNRYNGNGANNANGNSVANGGNILQQNKKLAEQQQQTIGDTIVARNVTRRQVSELRDTLAQRQTQVAVLDDAGARSVKSLRLNGQAMPNQLDQAMARSGVAMKREQIAAATNPSTNPANPAENPTAGEAPAAAKPATTAPSADGAEEEAFKPDDLIKITVADLIAPGMDTVKVTQVDKEGKVKVPVVGTLKASGLNAEGLKAAIQDALANARVMEKAQVIVMRLDPATTQPATQPSEETAKAATTVPSATSAPPDHVIAESSAGQVASAATQPNVTEGQASQQVLADPQPTTRPPAMQPEEPVDVVIVLQSQPVPQSEPVMQNDKPAATEQTPAKN